MTEDYNLELQYRKPFLDIWRDEKNDRELGPLSERMGVRDRETGELKMTEEEQDAASKCRLDCYDRQLMDRFLSCVLFLQGVMGRVIWLLGSILAPERISFIVQLAE